MGAIKNPEAVLSTQSVILPLLRTTTATSAAVDATGKDQVIFLVHYGTITDGTFTPDITASATSGGSYADDEANVSGTLTAGTSSVDDQVVAFTWNVNPDKPFVKLALTVTGSPATGGTVGASAILVENRFRDS